MKALQVNTQTFFKRAVGVAEHYGFCNVDDLQVNAPAHGRALDLHEHKSPDGHFDHHVLASVLAHLADAVELRKRQSLMFYTPSVVAHASAPHTRISALTLNAVGTQDPLAEIVVIKSAASILEELGMTNYVLHVNSIGDSDSAARFVREVGATIRQRVRDLSPEYAELVRTDIRAAIAAIYENRHPLAAELPSTLDYLTSPSRKYFKEVLELLEHTEIPFELDDKLYGNHAMYAHTMFELVERPSEGSDGPGEVFARGGRYDNLTRSYARTTVPATGIVIAMQTKDQSSAVGRPKRQKPTACLIHIGREARIKSISIVDTFRRAKIPIEQCLQYERFSEQIAYAEAQDAKYVIILGQREVHENVVIIRNASDRSQRTIPIEMLPEFFRNTA